MDDGALRDTSVPEVVSDNINMNALADLRGEGGSY